MNFQIIIVGLIVFAAVIYLGVLIANKIKSFKSKNSGCESDCGCVSKK